MIKLRRYISTLLMLVLFLSVGAASHLVTDAAAAPLGRAPGWLPDAVVLLLALSP